MAAPIPTIEPTTLVAGDTAKWQRTLDDYPANQGWTLTYTLVNATQRYTFTAAASGSDHLVSVAAATTSQWSPGTYSWRAQVSKTGEVYTVGNGQLVVADGFSEIADVRSVARTALDNINAYFQNSANLAAAKYEIAGRMLMHHPMADLIKLRSQFQIEVASEEAAQRAGAGLPDKRRIFVRFQSPS